MTGWYSLILTETEEYRGGLKFRCIRSNIVSNTFRKILKYFWASTLNVLGVFFILHHYTSIHLFLKVSHGKVVSMGRFEI